MSHIYTGPDGKLYPSVTTVLDLFSYNQSLMGWANYLGFQRKDYKKELDKTAVIGTWVHAHCQKFVDPDSNPEFTDLPDPMTRFRAEKRVNTFKEKISLYPYKTIFTEKTLVSPKLGFAGTLDWLCEFWNTLTLFDFKTSKAVRSKMLAQLGGYALLLEEELGMIPLQSGIILVGEDVCSINTIGKRELDIAKEVFLRYFDAFNKHDMIEEILKTSVNTLG